MVFDLTRREFLISMGAGPTLAAPYGWIPGGLDGFQMRELQTLLVVARTLFPHSALDATHYVRVVEAICRCCERNASAMKCVSEGLTTLRSYAASFDTASEATRIEILKTMEMTDFFRVLYTQALENLYGDPGIWDVFAYETSRV